MALGTIKWKINVEDSEKELLGHSFRSYETMTRDFMDWYRELPGDKRGIQMAV